MNQALYAHMNNKRKMKKKSELSTLLSVAWLLVCQNIPQQYDFNYKAFWKCKTINTVRILVVARY
jgi:hypothetical protein